MCCSHRFCPCPFFFLFFGERERGVEYPILDCKKELDQVQMVCNINNDGRLLLQIMNVSSCKITEKIEIGIYSFLNTFG